MMDEFHHRRQTSILPSTTTSIIGGGDRQGEIASIMEALICNFVSQYAQFGDLVRKRTTIGVVRSRSWVIGGREQLGNPG